MMPGVPGTPTDPLPAAFYDRDVVEVARDLLGCVLVGRDGTSGIIVETEAYHQSEPSCHAYRGLTPRTAPLFGPPGHGYVYFTYGMHWCFNAVCCAEGEGAAVLVRALHPTSGLDTMRARRSGQRRPGAAAVRDVDLCSGPAKLVQALDIRSDDNERPLWRADEPVRVLGVDPAVLAAAGIADDFQVVAGPRIGITVAIDLPWRFGIGGSRYLSRAFPAPARTGGGSSRHA